VAAEQGIPLEEDTVSRLIRTPSLKADQIHPNAEGYRQLAEAVAAKLKAAGAI
jgi:lysophospholipase L1-like esterase